MRELLWLLTAACSKLYEKAPWGLVEAQKHGAKALWREQGAGLTASFLPLSSNTLLLLAEVLGTCSTMALLWSAGNLATFLPMGHWAYEDSGSRIHFCVTVHPCLCCFCFYMVAVLRENVSNCLLVILKAVIIQELPSSVSYLVLHWMF